jgi:signal transduction histidine kinase
MTRDIHDTLAQGFTGVIIQLDTAVEALRDEEPEPAAKHISGRVNSRSKVSPKPVVQCTRYARKRSRRPHFLTRLRRLLQIPRPALRSRVIFSSRASRAIQSSVEENLLRIGQEALANALKHARATKFQARLSFDSEAVCLELCDNGQGFVVDCVNGRGIGLIGMKERAQQIGATLAVTSKPGKGTTIVAVSAYPTAVTT